MSGKVFLIGAGPGDVELLTLKAKRLITTSDVVVYDALVSKHIMDLVPETTEKIYVGKRSSNHAVSQDGINEIIVEQAKMGKSVARIKGGDPYVFGRGGEECEELIKADVEFEVIPGITSAIGGLCYGGIPITHRDHTSSFHVFTGHFKNDKRDHDWEVVAKLDGTLVFLMGVANLERIMGELMKNGKDVKTPVAMIQNATRPNQKVVTGTVDTIVKIAKENNIAAPALLVVGGVASLADKLNWFEKKELFGNKIVVTRSRVQKSKLTDRLTELGAEVYEVPSIKIEKIENSGLIETINNISSYDYLVLTSENGVKIFKEELFGMGLDARALMGVKVVAIGSATAKASKEFGIVADVVPEKFTAEGVLEKMLPMVTSSDKILIPRAVEARAILVDELSKVCTVDEVKIYNTKKEIIDEVLAVEEIKSADFITFTSSSTVKNFTKIIDGFVKPSELSAKIISIGPITTNTAKELGYNIDGEADIYTIDGLVKEVIRVKQQ